MNPEATKTLQARLKRIDEIKLEKAKLILLQKIIDLSSMEEYDSEEIKHALYQLFFIWD